MIYEKLGQPDKALADFSKAIELDPKLRDGLVNRGVVYEKLGQWDKALDHYSKAIELDPNRELAWSNRGVDLREAGPTGQGARRLLQSHRIGPKGCEGLE